METGISQIRLGEGGVIITDSLIIFINYYLVRPAICLNTVYITLCPLGFPDSMVVLVYPWKATL